MEYSHSDAELVRQPIGYWTWAAYKAVVTRTRGALAELGLSQPQWWVLHQVYSAHEEGRTRAEVTQTLRGYLDVGDGLGAEIDGAVAQGWVEEDSAQRLHGTPEGAALYAKAAELQHELWAERHADISDEEYLTTLKVLQRFIRNTGGTAWHH
ncbi:MarR family winged helix-turn-helix transcriptional regulator [Streptomyces palmae]|uniref:MarR family transcriptional regulator n=1 Tax=Streptomyces palmae TaxID=1701085 RepID=A0A4Z0FX33_9ACTN|nr:MarR family winged helix-turn-helix transcriptional regulator [Streptomyces palmae]TGA87772.1 MarR family transcriptional regulator [Streptomyces palmae]